MEALSGNCPLTSAFGLERVQQSCPECRLQDTLEQDGTVEIIFVGPTTMRSSGEVVAEIEMAVGKMKPLFLVAEVLPTVGEGS